MDSFCHGGKWKGRANVFHVYACHRFLVDLPGGTLPIIRDIMSLEFERKATTPNTILRVNSIASKICGLYVRILFPNMLPLPPLFALSSGSFAKLTFPMSSLFLCVFVIACVLQLCGIPRACVCVGGVYVRMTFFGT